MPLAILDSDTLYGAILTGCQSIKSAQQQLNDINVFPVADGDTGDNMASTALAIIRNTKKKPTIHALLNSVAEASMRGARGNSGIIFSQFFNALADTYHDKTTMGTHEFAAGLEQVATRVRQSIAIPVDGTLLTMIEAFAQVIHHLVSNEVCFDRLFKKALPLLHQTLKNTTNTLSVLKDTDMIDAGALGFYCFIEGVSNFLSTNKPLENIPLEDTILPMSNQSDHSPSTLPKYRFCTEVLLRGQNIDMTQIMPHLEQLGDSLVYTGHAHLTRIHMHTNQPGEMFSVLMSHGALEAPKVEDMQRQFEVIHHRKHSIALVTDSSADLPQPLQDEFQVHLIPVNVHLDEHHLLDRYCFNSEVFYKNLETLKHAPKTSLPSLAFLEDKLKYLSHHYEHVLILSVAKVMSGTFNLMNNIAQKYGNITVIDSRTNSGAHGLLVNYAGELIQQGHSFEKIVELVEVACKKTTSYLMINQLDSLVRSGRIHRVVGRLGQLSNLKPIFSIDTEGKAFLLSSAFNTEKALSKIIDRVKKTLQRSNYSFFQYCIVHAGVKEKAIEFAAKTTEAFKKPPVYIEEASPAIGLHAGQGSIALAIRFEHHNS